MNYLGISPHHGTVYEGNGTTGNKLTLVPFLYAATVVVDESDLQTIPSELRLEEMPMLFREDSFDSVTRVRRGRLYREEFPKPKVWGGADGLQLVTFQSAHWTTIARDRPYNKLKLALGTQTGYSLWDILLVEHIAPRDFLLTLRLKTNLYPILASTDLAIPAAEVLELQRLIDAAVDTSRRLDANATIDACRHAACAAVKAWLRPTPNTGLDAEGLAKKLDGVAPRPYVMANSLRTIAKLHVRTKPGERERHGLRENEESDGEAALTMLSLILREARRFCPSAESATID